MLQELPSFGHLVIARRASGEPVHVVRSPDEKVFLAFDTEIRRLIELHVLNGGKTLEGEARRSALEWAQKASEVRGPSFMRVLKVGEDADLVYYTSNLSEGEFVADYISRRGPLPPATVFSLVLQLLDDLMLFSDRPQLLSRMRLDRVMVSTLEDTFLQLRLYDYGLTAEKAGIQSHATQVVLLAELIFLMLTGKSHAGENADRYPVLTALPMSLRTTVRTALADPENAPSSLEKLREEVREACGAFISNLQARNSRRQLVVTPALQPSSQLQNLLLEGVPVEKVLGSRYSVEDVEDVRRHPFSIPCLNVKTDQKVTVHLLPPSRIVDKSRYEAVPLQSWRFSPEKHPNILRSLSLWESPEWSFLTEEREPGFTLSRLLTERITLNPAEVILLLRQVSAGLDQALECGVESIDLHPSNIVLRVGKPGPMQSREHERLMQKRIDVWPPFTVKLRAHLTMRNLYESPLVDQSEMQGFDGEKAWVQECRHRNFAALAAYLLTGARQVGTAPAFPETVPETLAAFIHESFEQARLMGRTPAPAEFLAKFEASMNGPAAPDLATRLRGGNVALDEMESAGSVSDFADDQSLADEADFSPISRRLHAHEFNQRPGRRSIWPIWAAAAIVILGLLVWFFMPANEPEALANENSPPTVPPPAATAKTDITAAADTKAETKPEPPKASPPQLATSVVVAASAPPPVQNSPTEALPMTPPPPVKVQNPVIIRKALLPSQEEIIQFKQSQRSQPAAPETPQSERQEHPDQRIGSVPTINVSQPLSPEQAQDRR